MAKKRRKGYTASMAITAGENRIESPSETLTHAGATVGYWYRGEDAIAQAVASERAAVHSLIADAVAAEREACAQIAQKQADEFERTEDAECVYYIPRAIRARGEQEKPAE